MRNNLMLKNFLDFKQDIRIRSISESHGGKGWYDVYLNVRVKVSRYYILQAILELVVNGNRREVIVGFLKLSLNNYTDFLLELKDIIDMPGKTVIYIRRNREEAIKRFNDYFSGGSQ